MLINGKQIRPMLGHCYIRMESLFRNSGQIVIPAAYKTAPHIIGQVVDLTLGIKEHWRANYIGIGTRVIVNHYSGRPIQDNIYDYPVESILAAISGDVDLKAISQNIERCRFCGNAKTGIDQSVILWEGRCPRCRRDKYGVVQPANPAVTVSDSEVEAHEAAIYRKNPNRLKKTISLAH